MMSVTLYYTTLRDGSQGEGISFSLHDKLKIVRKLDEIGIHYIEGGWPGSNPKDEAFFAEARHVRLQRAKLAAFGCTRRAKVEAAEDTQLLKLVESATPV